MIRLGMSLDADVPKGESANLVEEDSALLRAGLDYLAQNPGAIPELLWVKFFVYWGVDIWPPQNPPTAENFATLEAVCPGQGLAIGAVSEEDPLRIYDEAPEAGTFRLLHRWYFGPLLLLAILGVALSWREWRQVSLLWGVAAEHDAGVCRLPPGHALPRTDGPAALRVLGDRAVLVVG